MTLQASGNVPAIASPQWGVELRSSALVVAGLTYQVYLIGYNVEGLQAAWDELQRHARFAQIEEGLFSSGQRTHTAALRSPSLLGRTSQGQVYDATGPILTWRDPGDEYTWGRLFRRLADSYAGAARDGSSLGGWLASREAPQTEIDREQARAEQEVWDSGWGTVTNVTGAVGDTIEGASSAVAGVGAGAQSLGEGLQQIGGLSRVSPLATTAAAAGIAVAIYFLAKELR